MVLKTRQFEFHFPRPTLVMGVLNVTPDSFSDGGQFYAVDQAVEQGLRLVEEGADVIDVGGESTRPGATPVRAEEELRRVFPVVEELARQIKVPLSIDTMKPAVARAALQAGASIVNDVAASRSEEEMWRVAAEFGAGYVAMHMQGTPQTMQRQPAYSDVTAEVDGFFSDRLSRLQAAGLGAEQIILDVGLGFGKSTEHNLQLLAALSNFTKWSRPLLLGASRKSFIGQVTGEMAAAARGPGSLACACWAVTTGVSMVRTHDVAWTRQALRMMEAILAQKK